jgi:hypothetical protein
MIKIEDWNPVKSVHVLPHDPPKKELFDMTYRIHRMKPKPNLVNPLNPVHTSPHAPPMKDPFGMTYMIHRMKPKSDLVNRVHFHSSFTHRGRT